MNGKIMTNYCFKIDNEVWFITTWDGKLCKYNIDNKKLIYISSIPDKYIGCNSFGVVIKHDDYVYCFPDLSVSIWRYDLKNNKWICICKDKFKTYRASFNLISIEKNHAILFSKGYGSFYYFDLKLGRIVDEYEMLQKGRDDWGQIYVEEETIYLVNKNEPNIYIVNLKDKTYKTIIIPDVDKGMNTLTKKGDFIWLTGFDKKIICWNIATDKFNEILLPREFGYYDDNANVIQDNTNKYPTFVTSIVINERIIFLPFLTNYIVSINKNKVSIVNSKYEEENSRTILRDYRSKFTEANFIYDDMLVVCSVKNASFMRFEYKDRLEYEFLDVNYTKNYMETIFEKHKVEEFEQLSINDFVSYIKE